MNSRAGLIYAVTMKTRSLLAIGILGSAIAVSADLFLGYFPSGIHGFETAFTVDLDKVYTVLAQASHTRLLLSNYLAAVGIPLGWFGLFAIYRLLDNTTALWPRLMLGIGTVGYVCGTLFHLSLSYIATAYREMLQVDGATRSLLSEILELFAAFSQPLAYVFLLASIVISILFAVLVFRGDTPLPRWMAGFNPLTIQIALALLAMILPLATKTFVVISVYNFSLLLFYAGCLFVLRHQAHDDHR